MSREYRFDRYRKGRKMAEGLVLTKPTTVEQAMETVYLLAGPSDTFVLREDLACLAAVEAERDAARAERDAARAGEARAVECLKEIDEYNGGADSVLEDEYVTHRRMEVMEGGASSLAWLAQQRREAAAEALEKLATDLWQDPWGGTLHDVDSLRSILRTRAAALLAGGE